MVKQNRFDKIILFGITVLLIFAPLAFGSVHVWAYCLVEFGVFSLLALWFVGKLLLAKSDTLEWVKTPVNLVLVLLLVLIGMQMVPLPSSWIAFFSPRTFADKMQLFEVMTKATDSATQVPSWISLCYYLHPALVEWLKLAAYMGMFFLVLNTARSKRQINILVYVLILVGLFEAVYAVFQVFSVTPKVWWWKSRSGGGRYASGTFIVSNHFAGYMEMCPIACFWFYDRPEKTVKKAFARIGRCARANAACGELVFSRVGPTKTNLFLFCGNHHGGGFVIIGFPRRNHLPWVFDAPYVRVIFHQKEVSKIRAAGYSPLFDCFCLRTQCGN